MSVKSARKRKKILIIDDDVYMTAPLSQFLGENEFSVKVSHTGIDGIKDAQKMSPDVILLDIGLPDMTGGEVFDEIKERQIESRVIMFSGRDDVDSIIKFMRAGASDYITKPILGEELIWKLDRAIELGISIDQEKAIDELRTENSRLKTENNNLQNKLKTERTKIENLNKKSSATGERSQFLSFAIRTFYIILSSVITWIFFQSGLIKDVKLLFLLPLLLFLLLLFPIDRIRKFTAKYSSSEASVDIEDLAHKDSTRDTGNET